MMRVPPRPGRRRRVPAARVGLAVVVVGLLTTGSSHAQRDPVTLSDFETCLAVAMDRFETALARSGGSGPDFDLVGTAATDHCGILAIWGCDRSDRRLACQQDLAVDIAATRDRVLAAVPDPEALAGRDPIWSDGLYPRLWHVAHSPSAGPDCAGADVDFETWCDARQASLRLSEAVMLWQVARVMGAVPPAVEAGWVQPAPPPVPLRRPTP